MGFFRGIRIFSDYQTIYQKKHLIMAQFWCFSSFYCTSGAKSSTSVFCAQKLCSIFGNKYYIIVTLIHFIATLCLLIPYIPYSIVNILSTNTIDTPKTITVPKILSATSSGYVPLLLLDVCRIDCSLLFSVYNVQQYISFGLFIIILQCHY